MTDVIIERVKPSQTGETEGIVVLKNLVKKLDFSKDINYFERCLRDTDDARIVLLAWIGEQPVGVCVVNFAPVYPLFRRLHIPEIQDLNVCVEKRGRGVATALVRTAEECARGRGHTQMGIGVGLTAGYGAAQRLYVKLGYVPDGAGVSDDGQPVRAGDLRAFDDDLCLYMVREI